MNAMKRYAVIIENGATNYGAYVHDFVGNTVEEAEKLIGEAIEFHLDGMREDGDSIPEPTTIATYIEMPTV